MIKVIFLADIVGKIGRKAVSKHLPKLKQKYKPDLVIANVENLAHGVGFSDWAIEEMVEAGVDVMTSGNHAWKKAGADDILDADDSMVIRPANYSNDYSGEGIMEFKIGSNKVIVINLLGRVFMVDEVNCPFKTADKLLKGLKGDEIVIVDFHSEATSEQMALFHHLDSRVSAVIGTHTHVPTCDLRISKGGTAHVSDAGMIGYYDSVIGSDKGNVVKMFLGEGTGSKKHDVPDHGKCQFNSVYLEIDPKSGKAKKIERLDKIINIK
jgi:2',3'-cyclic-nucleotide 2'-phosphodiesterase